MIDPWLARVSPSRQLVKLGPLNVHTLESQLQFGLRLAQEAASPHSDTPVDQYMAYSNAPPSLKAEVVAGSVEEKVPWRMTGELFYCIANLNLRLFEQPRSSSLCTEVSEVKAMSRRGTTNRQESQPQSRNCFVVLVKVDPNLNASRYNSITGFDMIANTLENIVGNPLSTWESCLRIWNRYT